MTSIPKAALSQHVVIVGKTGGGKTITAKGVIESVAANAHVCILDPIKSDWWGLALDKDGKRPGLPFDIIGGPYGHVPLHADAGKALGQVVGSGALRHSIIDMADFGPGDLHRFYVPFAEALFKAKMPDSGVLYLVLEEAHVFCPKERDGVQGENLGIFWTKRLASAARTKGVRLVVVTQRTQALHNAVLGSCDTIIPHRLTLPADQDPIRAWLKGNVDATLALDVASSLSSLKTGEGWVISGEVGIVERMRFPMIRTYDNSSTPTEASSKVAKPPAVDQDRLRAIIGDAVVEAEANDPKKLRARIAELERAAKTAAPAVDLDAIRREADEACKSEYLRGIHAGRLAERTDIAAWIESRKCDDPSPPAARVSAPPPAARTFFLNEQHTTRVPKAAAKKTDGINGAQQRILDAVAMWHDLGVKTPTVEQVAFVAKINPKGGHFSNSIGPLVTAGYLFRQNGSVELAPLGRQAANFPKSAMSLREYHENMRSLLSGGAQVKILNAVIDAGTAVTVEEIGSATGIDPAGGHFSNSIGPLSTLGLIERSKGVVRPTALLFPEGLR